MLITEELVDYLSELSRLRLPPEERGAMTGELAKIVDYIEVLNGLDTEGVEPMSHVVPVKNVMRPDQCFPSSERAELLENAPERDPEGTAFLVPKAIE